MKQKQSNQKSNDSRPPHEQVALHAELLWRAKGCPEGKDEEIWLEAERQLVSENEEIRQEASR